MPTLGISLVPSLWHAKILLRFLTLSFQPFLCFSASTRYHPSGDGCRFFLLVFIADVTSRHAEFKEIRKEWKVKKKEEEAARKAEEDRRMQAHARAAAEAGGAGGPPGGPGGPGGPADQNLYGQMRPHVSGSGPMGGPAGTQLPPPIGYAAAQAATTTQPGGGVVYGPPQTPIESMAQYANSQMYGGAGGGGSGSGPSGGNGGNGSGSGAGPGYPQSPYGSGGPIYQQRRYS